MLARPQPGRGEQGQRRDGVQLGQFECDPAAERVADDVRIGDAELVKETCHGCGERRRAGFDAVAQRLGLTEAGQVDGEDVEILRECGHDGLPGTAVEPEPV